MLVNLPNEVLSQIVAELTPDDLINTALSCKTLYSYCKNSGDLERHMNRQKVYTVLNIGSRGMDPLDLIKELNEDWRVAYYVKAVHLKCPLTGPLFAKKPHGGVRYLVSTTEYASQAMLSFLEPLLLLLPNLGRLRFIDFTRQPLELKDLVKRVDSRKALTKLQVVQFVKSEAPTELEIEWREGSSSFKDAFNPWGYLPSVHTLRAENIILNEDWAQRRVRITALELINCSIELDVLERFLARCTNLKRFTFDWNLGQCIDRLFDEEGMFYILSTCCGDTLEYVRLTGRLPSMRLMLDDYDLRGLPKLKQTHLSLDLFVDADQSWEEFEAQEGHDLPGWRLIVSPLQEFLPSSTEEITIDFRKIRWRRELNELLGYLVSNKYSLNRVPLLKSVVVETDQLTADEVKRLNDYWQERSETLEIAFRLVDV